MFWGLGVMWLLIYLLGWGLEYGEVIKYSPLTLFPFFIGLAVIYVLSGINIVKEWERRPVLLFGKYAKTAGPGFDWIEPAIHTILDDVLVQDVVEELKVENVQTHDNVRVNIIGVLTTRIHPDNVKKYIVEVADASSAVSERANAAVTEVVGRHQLDHILDQRQEFSEEIRKALQVKVQGWGIEVKAVEIKDFKIADTDIEKSIAMKARAVKEAEAELKRAEMQKQIAEQLKEAAHTYDMAAWRLKGLETLIELCRSAQNNTVLIPTELLGVLANLGVLDAKKPAA